MRKDIFLLGLAAGGGAFGFGLRKWHLAAGYDPHTQLFLRGHPAAFALIALSLALAAVFLLLLWKVREPCAAPAAFRCPSSAYMALMAASALLFLGAGVLGLLEGMEQLALWRMNPKPYLLTYPMALILCALLTFSAGPSTLMLGRGAYRGVSAPTDSLLVIFPALTALVWLFTTHLAHSVDPILMRYGFSLAAAALLLLAHYDTAAFYHDRAHPRRTMFCSLLGISMGLISLADGSSPFQMALTAAFVLSASGNALALLRGAFGPPQDEHLPDGGAADTMP